MSSKAFNTKKTDNSKYTKTSVRTTAQAPKEEPAAVNWNKLPGFRRGKLWEMILAIAVYGILLYLLISYIRVSDAHGIRLVLVLFGLILLDTNYRNVWHHFMNMDTWREGARALVLFLINSFLVYIVVSMK